MRTLAIGVATLLAWSIAPAQAQMDSREGIALQNQILELRRDLQQLRDQGGAAGGSAPTPVPPSSSGAPSDISATLLDRVSRLEDAVREMRGKLDEADNARQRQGDDLNKRIGDLEFKLNGGAGPSATPPSRPGPLPLGPPSLSPPPGTLGGGTSTPSAPPPAPTRRTPEMALQEGNAALNRRDYATAEAASREVLATGRGPRATDAQFLLAQSMAGRRDYQGAAVAFDDAYNRNPRGSRAPDSLLGLANSLNAINEKKAACQTLDKLRAEFQGARPDLRPAVAAARQRAACG